MKDLPVDLSEFDDVTFTDGTSTDADEPAGPQPIVAVVGRPNVGKSTLVNRIIGRRQAVVEDVPGVTRDRVPYDANWNGRRFTVVDTGGWEPDARDRAAAIAAQAEIAVQTADVVVFVVDATIGSTDMDEKAVRMLRRSAEDATDVAATEADLARRDKLDSSRAVDPLKQASDATELDTTGMGIDEVVNRLLDMLNSKVSS